MTKIPLKVELEKGIDIPPHSNTKYPFKSMKIGESFFVPESEVKYHVLYSSAHSYSSRHEDYKFLVRKLNGGTRVWRVE